jgi:DNA-binding NarL/FixJ family response regulator
LGRGHFSSQLKQRAWTSTPPSPTREPQTLAYPDGLSEREVEVLRLIARGHSNKQIADDLVLSIRTVERHIANLYAKAGVRTKAQATAYAHLSSLV